ncbi:MarR family winged helix-turn-helix transcriptional regulator [Arenibaculum pallidiluteum]|uniref:MarR family winged helix-turn-helix transcriptional regulator n=1 Tax=Arenibaculum pallidiluteum TaxID=2812559 RepID=UPI001A9748D5|nr:MarR family transcriptional regulator [Arenibaculum pallidiluteum]
MQNTAADKIARDRLAAGALALDRQLCFAVYSAGLAFSRRYKPILNALGLTYPQYLVMLVLWEEDGGSVKDIGERLSLDSATLTPLLKRLEEGGLVTRERDPADERRVRIRLTEAGRALRARAEPVPAMMGCAIGLQSEALERLRADLEHLRRSLSGEEERGGDAPA